MHFAMTTRANVLVLMLSFFTLVSASVAMKRSALDVYAPQITYPTTGTVWKAKSRQNVTWCVPLSEGRVVSPNVFGNSLVSIRDVSDPPKQITNRNSQIRLVYKDMITPCSCPCMRRRVPHCSSL
jgi:hypothetical protein